MRKFKITFKHTVEEIYTCVVEAETKSEALEIFDESPFDCAEIPDEPNAVQGLSIEVIETIKID
jgi:hypothetical protein